LLKANPAADKYAGAYTTGCHKINTDAGAATANDWCQHVCQFDHYNYQYQPEQLNKSLKMQKMAFFFLEILVLIAKFVTSNEKY
jgi:hypothetical protein